MLDSDVAARIDRSPDLSAADSRSSQPAAVVADRPAALLPATQGWCFTRAVLASNAKPSAGGAQVHRIAPARQCVTQTISGRRALVARRPPTIMAATEPFAALLCAPEHALFLNRVVDLVCEPAVACSRLASAPPPGAPYTSELPVWLCSHWVTCASVDVRQALRDHAREMAVLALDEWPVAIPTELQTWLLTGNPDLAGQARASARQVQRRVERSRQASSEQLAAVWLAVWACSKTSPAAATRWISRSDLARERLNARLEGAVRLDAKQHGGA